MAKTKITLLITLVFGLIASCNLMKSTQTIDGKIRVNLTECGSYEVKNNQISIGYLVKPFFVKVDEVSEITDFEKKLKNKYRKKLKNKIRIFFFTKNRDGDTILMTHFLSSKYLQKIPDWKCELQEVGTYPRRTISIDYNCSKNRFKVLGDLD